MSRLRPLVRRLRRVVPGTTPNTVSPEQSPDAEPSTDKVKHWKANKEEFEHIKEACGRCEEDDPCTFHGMAERRMNGADK